MKPVVELDWIARDLAIWHGFNPEVRCECGSTAALTDRGWVIFDPIPLAGTAWQEILNAGAIFAVALTSGNHQRESLSLKQSHGIPVYAPAAARGEIEADFWLGEGEDLAGFSLIELPGAAPGESAWCDRRRLVFGDALIHLDGLGLLPDKYCSNPRQLRKSLRKLLEWEFDTVFFAHGLPLLSRSREKITAILE